MRAQARTALGEKVCVKGMAGKHRQWMRSSQCTCTCKMYGEFLCASECMHGAWQTREQAVLTCK